MTNTKVHLAMTWAGAAALTLTMAACGADGKGNTTGQGLSDSSSAGTVSLVDSSATARTRTAAVQADGAFSVDMAGLEGPYLVRLEWTDAAGVRRLYAVAEGAGNVDVNDLTNLGFRSGHDDATDMSMDDAQDDHDFEHSSQSGNHGIAIRSRKLLAELSVVLAPLFERYGITDPRTDRAAVRLLLKDVKLALDHRIVTVTNRATGGVIFTGRLSKLSEGTFTAANMPAGPGGTGETCASFTYSAFGDCQPDGTQARTVLTSLPAGCTGGSPSTTQACSYVPPANACTSFTYSAFGDCQPDGTQARTVLTSLPAGCTGGSPSTTQACSYVPPVTACTSFTYSAYGACQSDSTQTRTVLTSLPAGCTGGSPVVTQACVFTPPLDGAALYTQNCTSCHGNGKKGSSAGAIQGAIDANVGGMGSASLRALTPAQVSAIAAAP